MSKKKSQDGNCHGTTEALLLFMSIVHMMHAKRPRGFDCGVMVPSWLYHICWVPCWFLPQLINLHFFSQKDGGTNWTRRFLGKGIVSALSKPMNKSHFIQEHPLASLMLFCEALNQTSQTSCTLQMCCYTLSYSEIALIFMPFPWSLQQL